MMKKNINRNAMRIALGALLFLGPAAYAQRGSQQANGGGSSQQASPPPAQSAPPAARPSYTPPPQQTYTPPRSAPAPQQTYTPPPQRSTQPAQNNVPSPQRNMPQGMRPDQQQVTTWGGSPRGAEHAAPNVATSRNPNNNTASQPQRGNQGQNGYNGRNNSNYGRSGNNGYYGNRGGYRQGSQGYYRSYPGLEYGKNHITARPQGFYYRNRGYYGTYYAPQLGFSLNVLPYGYYPFYHGQSLYYYSDGLYYQRNADANNYSVVAPPIGAAIKSLPDDAQSIVINGVQYYESNGVYYEPIKQDDGSIIYQIAGKDGELNTDGPLSDEPPLQMGELVDSLPYEYKIIKLNGQKYYMTPDGYYFQDAVDADGNKVYKVAGVPAEEEEEQPKR